MKKILLFISGMVIAALLVAASAFFLLEKPNPQKLSAPQNTPKAEYAIDPSQIVTVTGTIVMPPEIKAFKPGKGAYTAHLAFGPSFNRFVTLDPVTVNPEFPREFTYKIQRDKFDEMISAAQGWFAVAILYLPNGKVISNGLFPYYLYFEPAIMGYLKVPAELFQSKTNQFNLGEIRFDQVTSPSANEKCPSDTPLLSGKIAPPSRDQQKSGNSKFALVIYPNSKSVKALKADASPAEFEKSVLHYQYLDFSHGAASFTAPAKQSTSVLLSVAAVRCEASEDLKACAQAAFPPVKSLHNADRVFVLRGTKNEASECGQKNLALHLISRISH